MHDKLGILFYLWEYQMTEWRGGTDNIYNVYVAESEESPLHRFCCGPIMVRIS